MYFIRKRRPKAPETENHEDRAQLDREGVKPKEVGADEITELEGRHVAPVGMDAGYSRAEMPGAKSNITRNPVPRREERG